MATRTVASRRYDHLYDPTYTVGGQRDAARQAMGSVVFQKVPDAQNMFSEISAHPSHSFRQDARQEVPAHVAADAGAAVQHPGGGATAAAPQQQAAQLAQAMQVTGSHRYKFFRRPIVPFLHSVPPEVLLAPSQDTGKDPLVPADEDEEGAGATRTVGVQTKYRESEAQTDPYTPDYTVKPGAEPEILTLATLSYGTGLPAGLAEVEMIERARMKREFENGLPPITDEASFELRKRLMEEQELRDWSQREAEIDRLQEERLQLLRDAVQERDAENQFAAEQRIEALRQAKLEQKDAAVQRVQRMRIKVLRKLTKQRQAEAPKPNKYKRDIIEDYGNFGSGVYAPVTREGRHPDRDPPQFNIEETGVATLAGLAELTATLPRQLLSTKVEKPRKKAVHGSEQRKQATLQAHLNRMETIIHNKKLEDAGALPSQQPLIPSWRRTAEKTIRPPTPRVPEPAGDEEVQAALVLLQKLLRGRAVQNSMFEGKEKRRELIRELRESEAVQLDEEEQARADAEHARAQREQRVQDATADTLHGQVVSSTMDFLSKELVRFQELQRIAALAELAQQTRRVREAEESGRRQAEQFLRARQDIMFRQVQRVHQGTAESYLDEIFSESLEHEAHVMAVREVKVQQVAIAPIVDCLEDEMNNPDVVVRDLVASFLLPEVERHRVIDAVQQEERRFVDAAHRSIYQVVRDVEKMVGGDGSG